MRSRATRGGRPKGQAWQGEARRRIGAGMSDIIDPAECTDMSQVRAGVDDIDRQVVALLARRFGYMDAAARIKPNRDAVRDEWRKADVKAKVDAAAAGAGIDRGLLARLYEDLIETSISHELARWDSIRRA